MIPKAQHLNAPLGEKLVSLFILGALVWETMSTAIQFNRQPGQRAVEIQEVDAAGVLTTKLEFVETTVAQQTPEPLFRQRGFFAKPPGKVASSSGARTVMAPRFLFRGHVGRFDVHQHRPRVAPHLGPLHTMRAREKFAARTRTAPPRPRCAVSSPLGGERIMAGGESVGIFHVITITHALPLTLTLSPDGGEGTVPRESRNRAPSPTLRISSPLGGERIKVRGESAGYFPCHPYRPRACPLTLTLSRWERGNQSAGYFPVPSQSPRRHYRPARNGYFGLRGSTGGDFFSAAMTSSIARSSCGSLPLARIDGSSTTGMSGSTP
jgi:hypothetical protein